ncbi:MAG: asparagine synthase-related protein [Pseudomonadota bacterium]
MFAAIIMRGSREAPQGLATGEELLAALMPYSQADKVGVWQDSSAMIAQATRHNTPESLHENAPEICAETGRIIASWVRLDNRSELCAALKLEERPALSDPQLILAAHRRWGSDCADRLEGDFSFVIYDPERHEAYCARDSLGAKPFFYRLTGEHFVAATSVAAIKAMRGPKLAPSPLWTAQFAALINWSHTDSAFEGVKKLPAAHHFTVAREGAPEPAEYFSFDLAAPHATRRDDRWVDEYREAFDRAIKPRTRSAFLIGAESSGGLDSASIVASLMPVLPHSRDDFHCFGTAKVEYEPKLIDAVSQMCGIRHTHVLLKPEMLRIDDAFARAVKAIGHPPEHGQMLIHPSFFETGKELGIRTMFSGFGGDEVVTSYARHLADEMLARKEYGAVFAEMPGSAPMRAARLAKRLLRPSEDPKHGYRRLLDEKWAVSCIRRDFLEDSGLAERIDAQAFPERPAFTLNALAGLDPGFRYARPARLESAANFAATYGIEYRYPMLDRRLIQQFFATPSIEKRREDIGRYLHRRAMEGRIPKSIQWQKTKFMGNFMGDEPVVQKHSKLIFEELPELLQSIIDPEPFSRLQDGLGRSQDDDHNTRMRKLVFLWQVRQLTAWLGNESQ